VGNQPFARRLLLLSIAALKYAVISSTVSQHDLGMIGIVPGSSQHLGEVCRPDFQLAVVAHRHTQHLCRHNCRQGFSQCQRLHPCRLFPALPPAAVYNVTNVLSSYWIRTGVNAFDAKRASACVPARP